jgi:acyl-CoA thioester hydrolase
MANQRSRIEVPADSRDVPGDFAHRHLVEVRLADTDAMGHVNNANYLTYTEIARVAYYEEVVGKPLPLGVHGAEEGMILADIRVAYRSPAFFGEILTVETRIDRIGTTSLSQVHRITAPESRYAPRRLVAVAEAVLVSYDYGDEAPIAVPAEWRDAIGRFEGWPANS